MALTQRTSRNTPWPFIPGAFGQAGINNLSQDIPGFQPWQVRQRFSLDGTWQFQVDSTDRASLAEVGQWREAQVPMPWQAQFEDLREQGGTAWYRREFKVPADWVGPAVILHFGAVDYFAEVWLNGACVGDHEGGYLPFEFEISAYLRPGETNELVVRVVDPSDDPGRYPDYPFAEIPHGKQSWYGYLSGIWQPVWLERRAALHVSELSLSPNIHTGQVGARLVLSTPALEPHWVVARLIDPDGVVITTSQVPLSVGATAVDLLLAVDDPRPWSPDAPNLYRCEVSLLQGETLVDTMTDSLGFRTIEAREGQLFLNGEPLYLRAALDQDYYPDTICTPPSEAFLEDQLYKAKAMGLNCLRCHIKVADPRYYEVADRLGMLIWTELPNWRILTETSARRGRETLQGIVERDGNHPSIIIWTIINEGWGVELESEASHRAWLKEMYLWLKALDPTRLVVDNSPCWPNFHVQTDIDDFHHYRAIPDNRHRWDKFVTDFAHRPAWTFSQHGDAVRTGREPLIVSEFGNWGLPDSDLLLDKQGREPWWYETGHEWDDGIVYPHGIRNRFKDWRLDKVFGNWRAFIEATQWQQFEAFKYEIEAMRRHPGIVGYVITELTDVHWECNGLLDMHRNPKTYFADFITINADTVIVPGWDRVAYWAGEPVQVEMTISHGAGQAIQGAELRWRLESQAASGRLAVPTVEAGQAPSIGAVIFTAPAVTEPAADRLVLELWGADGQVIALNSLRLTFFPRRSRPVQVGPVWATSPELAERLGTLGYTLAPSPEAARVVVADHINEALMAHVRSGGQVLLLADRPEAMSAALPHIQVTSRQRSRWHGDWASSFAWLKRQGPFAALPGGPLLDASFDKVMPEYILNGFKPWEFEANVPAGLCLGWIHSIVALIGARDFGRGRVTLTTFRLTGDAPYADPVATALLDGLIALVANR